MKPAAKRLRRQPTQRRARQTVEVILDAVVKLLRRRGLHSITTNRIAEVAGVSVGSVYQYFPDKRAIFVALHERHAEQMSRVIESQLVAHAGDSLEALIRALYEALVDAHSADPELYQLLLNEAPHGANGAHGLEARLRGALRLAISSRPRASPRDLDKTLFVLTHMLEALAHGAVLGRPARLSLAAAKEEAVRAVLAYLRA